MITSNNSVGAVTFIFSRNSAGLTGFSIDISVVVDLDGREVGAVDEITGNRS